MTSSNMSNKRPGPPQIAFFPLSLPLAVLKKVTVPTCLTYLPNTFDAELDEKSKTSPLNLTLETFRTQP